jgi:hypothetical protein
MTAPMSPPWVQRRVIDIRTAGSLVRSRHATLEERGEHAVSPSRRSCLRMEKRCRFREGVFAFEGTRRMDLKTPRSQKVGASLRRNVCVR